MGYYFLSQYTFTLTRLYLLKLFRINAFLWFIEGKNWKINDHGAPKKANLSQICFSWKIFQKCVIKYSHKILLLYLFNAVWDFTNESISETLKNQLKNPPLRKRGEWEIVWRMEGKGSLRKAHPFITFTSSFEGQIRWFLKVALTTHDSFFFSFFLFF